MEMRFMLMMGVHVVPTALVIEYFGGILIAIEANAIDPHDTLRARTLESFFLQD
ncbi:MAG: hypothetical protein JSV85_02835 [Candidatus Bathyarchaeota archaeon]|nr:MAG: hypothetical protein JSV85_02835 [Candidatus Bathyarchaeota archaeon]